MLVVVLVKTTKILKITIAERLTQGSHSGLQVHLVLSPASSVTR